MNTNNQNVFDNQQSPLTPGRSITKVKQYISPSGQIIRLQWVTNTFQDNQGIFRTEEKIQITPPLSDGTVPEDTDQIRECFRCHSVVHEKNYRICPDCGLGFCLPCMFTTEKEGQELQLCVDCAKKIQHPFLHLVKELIWG